MRVSLQDVVGGGDASRGRVVFFGSKASCATCHRVGDAGGQVGPNLSAIARIRTAVDLLEAIVFPSASQARGFENYTILTTTGRVQSGIISRETAEAIYVLKADREEVRIRRAEIEEVAVSHASLMPQGLERTISHSEFKDLLAFLQSLR